MFKRSATIIWITNHSFGNYFRRCRRRSCWASSPFMIKRISTIIWITNDSFGICWSCKRRSCWTSSPFMIKRISTIVWITNDSFGAIYRTSAVRLPCYYVSRAVCTRTIIGKIRRTSNFVIWPRNRPRCTRLSVTS